MYCIVLVMGWFYATPFFLQYVLKNICSKFACLLLIIKALIIFAQIATQKIRRDMANQLMFEVGIKEADNQLTNLENRLKNIVSSYGKLELKVQVDGLKTFTSALESIGQGKGLEALQKRIDVLQVSLANVGMSGAKSIQEFEAAVKTTSAVAEQYTQRINQMTAARDKFAKGSTQWMALNNKLTDFQNDKQVVAIYAQEQVAIKNLEDAKVRLGNTNNQEAESFQKVISAIETLNNAANTLRVTLGTWDTNKGSVAQLIEQFEKLKNEVSAVAKELKTADVSKLNLSGLNLDLGKVAGIGDLNSAIRGLEVSINEIINLFSKLSNAVKLDSSSDVIRKLQADADAAQRTIQELTEKMNALAAAQNKVAGSTTTSGKTDAQVSASQEAMFNRYGKLLSDIQNIKREIVEIQRSTGGGGPFGDKLGEYFSSLNKIRNSVREITSAPSIADAIQRGMSSEKLAQLNSILLLLKSNYKDIISDANAFNKATDKGSSQAESRIRKLGMAFNELKNYMKANGGSEEMKRLQQEIQGAIRKMRDLMNAGNFAGAINVYERLSGIIRQAANATKEFEKGQQSLSSSVSHANGNLQHQSQILSDLKSMAMQYLSVWGAQSFINNIIELGGQLEQQRLSIGAILQDTAQANHLFGQIKDLAIRSPFGVQQLDAMTKQLSAYGFQYSELYEWTKRLADISAATGTSVDRLALALGHVRSEGALSGYTLRQFSMGNIPLLQKLSENLGKTKQEIRKMTRNKEIGYEDVLNVLKQLTDESGMFYQAQETMAQALNAKFKNLRDSFQIMYSEMAEGAPGDFLKGVAEVLTDISKSWRVLMPIILSGGAALGIWKLSTMALNHELERSGKLLVGNAIATSKYSMNQLRAIATTGRFKIALQGLGRALASIGKFVFNPVTLGFAAIEGLIYLWSKHNDEVRRAKDLTKAYGEEAVESEKNIAKQLENVKPFSNKLDDSALKTGIDSMTESIKNYAINGQSIINGMFSKDAEGNVMSLADKYQYLRGELENTIKVYKELKRVKDAFEYGITKSDSGWFDDDVDTDLTQYSEAYKKFVDDVTEYNSKYNNSIEKAIKNAQNSDLAFREATKNMKSYGEMLAEFWSNPNKYQNAAQFMNNLFGAGAGSDDALNLNESFFGYLNKKNEAMKELDQFIANTEERLKEKGYDFSKELAPEQVGALLKMSKEWIEKHPEWENIYGTIKDKLEGRWPIKIVPDTSPVEEELPEWMEEFQKELDKTGIVLTADMSMEQIVDLMKKAYDQAQTTINKLGPVALTAKINVVGMSEDEIEAYNNPLSPNYNPEMYQWLKQLKGAYNKRDSVDAAAKKRGIKLEGMKKDGTHKAEKQNQENAKAVREQVRVIKEAADAFQYWREKVGDKGAWEHVQKEFGDVLQKIGITATNIEDVREHLKKIPQTKEYQAITDKKVKTEIDKEIAKENDQYTRKDFERDTERFLSQTQIQLDNLTRSWETFNSVREATGNIALAVQLSGAEYEANGNQNIADALKKKIQKDFEYAGVVSIPLSVEWSDKQIEENVWEAFDTVAPKRDYFDNTKEGLDAYNKALLEHESRIKGVVEETKKWRDLQRDAQEKQRNSFAKLTADADALLTKMYSISTAFKDNSSAISAMYSRGEITQYQSELARWQNERMRSGSESEIKTSRLIMEAEMTNAFNEMGILLTTPLRAILDELRNETRTSGFRGRPMEEQMKVYNDIAKLEKVLNEFGSADVDGVSASMTSYILALGNEKKTYIELVEAQKRLTKAEENYEKAKRSGLEATINAAEEERNLAQERYNEALKSHTSSQANLAKAQSSANASLTKFTEGLNRFKSVVQGLTSKNASALWESIGPKAQQSVGMFISGAARLNSSLNKLGETLTENGSSVDIFQKQLGDVITNIISNSNPDNIISNVQSGISGIFTEVFGKGNFQDVKQSVQNVFGKIITDGLKEGKSIKDISNDVGKITGSILSSISTIGNKSGQLWGMIIGMILQILDMLGDYETSIGGLIGDLFENILAAVGGIVKNVFSGNFFKNIGVGIFEGIGSWFGYKGHDEELQEEIDAINANVKALDANTEIIKKYRSRVLGYDDGELRRRVGQLYKQTWVDFYTGFGNLRIEIPGLAAMKEFYNLNSKKTGYAAELENLKTQRLDILQMYALEDDKKDKSEEALSEYKKQIAELDEQILYFTEDLANELWGIDLKSWADQISDALWTAFENGESAVEAFGDTAKDIISDVARRMMNIHLIEPVFKALEDELFGKIGENGIRTGGVYNESTGQFDENETLRILGQFFGEDGEFAKVVESAEDFYEMAQRVTGINFTGEGDSSSASKTIKGITEQTADLLVSYANACRADLSVIRTLDSKVVQEYWPSQIRLMTVGTQNLANIESHTLAIMRSNEIVAERITNLDNNIIGLRNNTWRVPIG